MAENLSLKRAAGALERTRMISEAVVQHRGRIVGEREDPALTVRGRRLDRRLDQCGRPHLIAPERLQQQGAVADG